MAREGSVVKEGSVGREGSDPARCTRRLVQIAARNARFPSSRPKADLFIAGTASRSTEQREEAHHVIR
jgi:hypothetical protein